MGKSLLTIAETSIFARRAEKLLTQEEYEDLMFYLALHPESGDEGPVKSGGVRVIYYFIDHENPLYALLLYGKNEQAHLNADQKREIAALAAAIKFAARARRAK